MRWFVHLIGVLVVAVQVSASPNPTPLQPVSIQSASTVSSRSLFASSAVLELRLEAPVHQLFEAAQHDAAASVKGTLTYTSAAGELVVLDSIDVSVRGHSSSQETECDFPKLKLKLTGARDVLFKGIDSVKIGTHCGEKADAALSAKYGRWGNEKAAHREAFVYHLLEAMQVPTLKARPARITYVESGRAPLVRDALVLEDDRQAGKRLGASGQVTEEQFTSAREAMSPHDAARLAFAEAMIGNFDWCLRFYRGDTYRCDDRHPLWNILAFETAAGLTPVMYDFDLSGMVTGRHAWFSRVFGTFPGSEPEIEVLSQVQRTRTLFPRQDLDAVRMEFVRSKPAAYQALAQSALDEDGRRVVESYLTNFFEAIERDDRFYGPAVVAQNARAVVDAAGTKPACGGEAVLPGTPVSAALETSSTMIRVRILNALWQWDGEGHKCEALGQNEGVWIDSSAVSTDYPRR